MAIFFPQLLFTAILVLFFLSYIVMRILRSNNRSPPPKFPPNPLKLPLIGNLHQLLGKACHQALWELSKQYGPISGWNDILERGFGNLDAYIEMILEDHQNQNTAQVSDSDKDFVDALLEFSSLENASGYVLTKEDMKGLIMDMLLGGTDTTTVTMVWAMSEITRNTRVMRKLQDEIRNCSLRKQKRHELDITKMTYLKLVVKETLRMHPPLPLLIPHESISHCQIVGHDIFPKTTTLINAWGIGRDPNIWGNNAHEFYPERFVETDVEFGMIHFGEGRRSCPGINTASTTIEFMIA